MLLRTRNHLRQHVIAYVALFIVLGGSAVALPGRGTVTSDDIAKKAVKSKNLAKQAVKSKNIAKKAVKSKHLADGSVATAKIAEQAITSGKIAEKAVTTAKIADNAVGGAQADEASFEGLVKGDGELLTGNVFTADRVGFLPQPLILAEIPTMGQIRLIYCGGSPSNQIRVQLLSFDNSQPFFGVGQVTASALPAGLDGPPNTDQGGGVFSGGGGEPLIADSAPDVPAVGLVGKWDWQLSRGSGADAVGAHVSVSGINDPIGADAGCTVTAQTIIQN
jgi:hypothetical protein